MQHWGAMGSEIAVVPSPSMLGKSPRIHVVVSCTRRKRASIPPRLRLGSIPSRDTGARSAAWLERLRSEPVGTMPARHLYAGDHWQVSLSILAANEACTLSIVSAGYGLVGPDSVLKPYSATFSPGLDSVADVGVDPDSARRAWWHALAGARTTSDDRPRSLEELANSEPDAVLLVALSAPYVRALRDDLVSAAASLGGKGHFILVSAGMRTPHGLDGHIPVSAQLQHALGGARVSLNVRIARYLVREAGTHRWAKEGIVRVLGQLSEPSPDGRRLLRKGMTDADVIAFITRARSADPSVTKTRLLRRLRDQGRCCEQQRFGNLFMRVAKR